MSTYSFPSTSQTLDPRPRSIQIGCGREICQLEVTPPARDLRATVSSRVASGARSKNLRSSFSIRWSRIPDIRSSAGSMSHLPFGILTRRSGYTEGPAPVGGIALTPAPLREQDVRNVLRQFGSSLTFPAAAYASDEVL